MVDGIPLFIHSSSSDEEEYSLVGIIRIIDDDDDGINVWIQQKKFVFFHSFHF